MVEKKEKKEGGKEKKEKEAAGTPNNSEPEDKEKTEETKAEAEETESAEVVAEEIPAAPEEEKVVESVSVDVEAWKPKTEVGRKVKSGEVTDIDFLLDNGLKILEPEIVDILVPELESDLLFVGQSKGKFGGGQKRVFKQTQKKTREGNKPKFATVAVVGNRNGLVGIGYGKSKETVPAREKAFRRAKLNIIKIRRGCGSWECSCKEPHSIPFAVHGKVGSAEITLLPAPKGTGLVVNEEIAKILELVGVKDVWSKTKGQTGTKINIIAACFEALKQLVSLKVNPKYVKELNIVEGRIKKAESEG